MAQKNYGDENEIRKVMKEVFKFSDYKSKAQEEAIKAVLNGEKNVIVSMASHAGKSLCFQLPAALQNYGIVLVICPNIILIKNQTSYLNNLGLKAVSIDSTVDYEERDEIRDELKNCEETDIKFLYMCPEMAAGEWNEPFINELLSRGIISHVVVDEAHCVLDKDYRFEAYSKVKSFRLKHPSVPFIALTTASTETIEDIEEVLGMKNTKVVKSTTVRPNITYQVAGLHLSDYDSEGEIDFLAFFKSFDPKYEGLQTCEMPWKTLSGIIYCSSFREIQDVADKLQKLQIPFTCFTSKDEKRFDNFEQWMSNEKPIMVATTGCFGLGIVKDGLKFVMHVQMPENLRAFYQESGRAGDAEAISRVYINQFDLNRNDKAKQLFCSDGCFRRLLAKAFDEEVEDCINKCDNCIKKYANKPQTLKKA